MTKWFDIPSHLPSFPTDSFHRRRMRLELELTPVRTSLSMRIPTTNGRLSFRTVLSTASGTHCPRVLFLQRVGANQHVARSIRAPGQSHVARCASTVTAAIATLGSAFGNALVDIAKECLSGTVADSEKTNLLAGGSSARVDHSGTNLVWTHVFSHLSKGRRAAAARAARNSHAATTAAAATCLCYYDFVRRRTNEVVQRTKNSSSSKKRTCTVSILALRKAENK